MLHQTFAEMTEEEFARVLELMDEITDLIKQMRAIVDRNQECTCETYGYCWPCRGQR